MLKKSWVLLALAVFSGILAWGQVTSDFSLTVVPAVDIPLGPSLPDGTAFYTIGGGAVLRGEYVPPFAQYLRAGLMFGVDLLPINSSTQVLTLLSLAPEAGVVFFPIPRLGLRLAGRAGMYAGIVSEGVVPNFFAGGSAEANYLLLPTLSLGAGVSYTHAFTRTGPVYQGLGVSLSLSYHIGAGAGGMMKVEPDIKPIFPLFYSYYDKNPAGTLTIRNTSPSPIQDVKVSFYVRQFMDQPKVSLTWKELDRGEEKTFDVFALFKDSIFSVTENTKVAGEIEISYLYFGSRVSSTYPVTVTVVNRNGMTWDDTRKAAAFITSNDASVRSFAARAVPDARSRGTPAVNATFRSAMALFEAMGVHGVAYVPDPNAFASKVENKTAIDYLQFPAQTLESRAADCDDLSILYASLLEASGIEAAFVTTPGHIFVAFNVDLNERAARGVFMNSDDLIIHDGACWVPVEITLVNGGFLRAWRTGAQEWRAAQKAGAAGFTPVRRAWEAYAPANTGESIKVSVAQPDSTRVYTEYAAELQRFWNAEFQPRVDKVQQELKERPDDVALLNRLGVLYARFGKYAQARTQFEAALRSGGEPTPILVNLGNIAFLDGNSAMALDYYTRALKGSPDSSVALQGVARAGYDLGDTESVQNALAALKKADPEAAGRLAELAPGSASTGRAASGEKEINSWMDE